MHRARPLLLPALLACLAAPGEEPVKPPEALRAFFSQNCVRCHGADGSAHDSDGKRLKGADFTDPKAMAGAKDADLAKTILKGTFFGLGMPSFKKELSEQDALAMVREVLRKAEKGRVIGGAGK